MSETNANPGSASSYRLAGAALTPVTRALSTGQASTCWAAVTPDGRRAYLTNTAAHTISAYAIGPDASLTPIGGPIPTGDATAPTDVTTSPDGAFLYVLTNVAVGGGMQTLTTGVISSFKADVQTPSSTGALSPPSNQPGQQITASIQLATPAPGLLATSFCIDPNNKFAYCTLSDGRVVVVDLNNNGGVALLQQKSNGQNFINALSAPNRSPGDLSRTTEIIDEHCANT